MNFTPRKGGPMVTLRARHDLLPTHIAVILARYGDRAPGGDPRPEIFDPEATPESGGQPSRAVTAELIRLVLREFGSSAYEAEAAWDEALTKAEAALIGTWAVAQVRRLYPDAASRDARLDRFAREYAWTADGSENDEDEVTP